MRYLPKSPADRREMLAAIGVASIEDLFDTIPGEFRLTRDLEHSAPALGVRGPRPLSCVRRRMLLSGDVAKSWRRSLPASCLRAFLARARTGTIVR